MKFGGLSSREELLFLFSGSFVFDCFRLEEEEMVEGGVVMRL